MKIINSFLVGVLLLGVLLSTGCVRPFDKPEYAEVGTSQTAFVLPLEGDVMVEQAKFDSAQYLEAKKVAAKRIQIPHRWSKTGRLPGSGEWIPTVKVILVDRSPITCEWEADGKKGKDQAIWIESADSVGFSMGWSCTAYIKETDTAQFLYMYPSGSLETVMNQEIRARVQQVAALVAAKYNLDDLRNKKVEIAQEVQRDITAFFAQRGITITTIGMFGGMTYENPEIQEAIDQTFISQQQKVIAAAELAAQEDKNTRIKSEAQAKAEAAKMEAKGVAEGNLSKAQAEAKGIEAVNEAIAKANDNPMLIQLKLIEVERGRVEAWNGQYPSMVVGSDANVWVGLPSSSVPAVTTPSPASK